MGKYRKRPVIIEAIRFSDTKEGIAEALRFARPTPVGILGDERHGWALCIHTLEGDMRCESGDWLIRGVAGELYPCKPNIFEVTYELAVAQT